MHVLYLRLIVRTDLPPPLHPQRVPDRPQPLRTAAGIKLMIYSCVHSGSELESRRGSRVFELKRSEVVELMIYIV